MGDGRKLHNDGLHYFYSSPYVRVIILRRMKWAGHVKHTGEMRSAYEILMGKSEGKRPLGRIGIDVKTVLEWILEKQSGKVWTGFI